MSRRKKRKKAAYNEIVLNIMPFIDVFSMLNTFLLYSAVFLAVGIIEVQIPYLSLMNALRGLEYVFLFLITLFFTKFFPRILTEEISHKALLRKGFALVLIIIGLYILLVY